MTTATRPAYRIKGANGDETTCACCGRNDLTKVVWLAALDADGNEGEAAAYGSTCAARLIAPKGTRGVADQLTRLTKAVAFVEKHAGAHSLDVIRNAVSVKFGLWANVEGDTLQINTEAGWVEVIG